jgi:hypothetical protein
MNPGIAEGTKTRSAVITTTQERDVRAFTANLHHLNKPTFGAVKPAKRRPWRPRLLSLFFGRSRILRTGSAGGVALSAHTA